MSRGAQNFPEGGDLEGAVGGITSMSLVDLQFSLLQAWSAPHIIGNNISI